jgi:hypothetical protein
VKRIKKVKMIAGGEGIKQDEMRKKNIQIVKNKSQIY